MESDHSSTSQLNSVTVISYFADGCSKMLVDGDYKLTVKGLERMLVQKVEYLLTTVALKVRKIVVSI